MRPLRTLRIGACLVVCFLTEAARADDDANAAAAAAAFEEGLRAFDAGDYVRAATAFERAWSAKHHQDASWNAARARHRAGDAPAAANLYARYLREAPPTAKDRDRAIAALRELAPSLGRIEVHPAVGVAELRVDRRTLESDESEVWVSPGEHIVEGNGEHGPVRKVVTVGAGASASVTLDATGGAEPTPPPSPQPSPPEGERGLRVPWVVFAGGAAATAVLGGVTVWSGLDTVDQKRRFDETGTQEDLDEGRARQTRTNVLLGITIGLAVLTGVTALFVPWKGSGKTRTSARAAVDPWRGTFW